MTLRKVSEISTDSCSDESFENEASYQLFETDSNISLSFANIKAKSSLCRNYMETGVCPYGKRCQFAHGTEELRCNSNSHTTYKTKTCHAFIQKGYCLYGERCNFLHKTSPKLQQTS